MSFRVLAILLMSSLAFSAEPGSGPAHIVAIDVGHTKVSPGAISVTGVPEYEFNLRIAKRVEARLQETGTIKPFLIVSEKARTLPERTRIAASRNADLFVSIHHDSAQDKYLKERDTDDGATQRFSDKFSGYSIFVSRKNPRYDQSLDLARRIGRAMRVNFKFATHHNEAIAGENRPIIDREAGIYAFDDLVVLKTAAMPAVLVECGVIVNPEEEKSLLTVERQVTITAAIVRGIRDYFGDEAPVTPRSGPNVIIETTSPAPSRYPKPGTPFSPAPSRDN
jgi:N-acetylmuramoyl-L-alanine amidase